ncbi:MAG: GNAT family N-acetyltransferase [Bacteroidales bacterium]|nr:GNAT family N-acetyltransferase [Bacteroidales bacterium]
MKSKLLSLKNHKEWKFTLAKLPLNQRDIYFTPEYYHLHEKYGDGTAFCFVFEKDDDIAVYPFLMNKINQALDLSNTAYYDIQGAYGYNGVLSSSYNENFINAFYQEFNDFCKNENIIAEFTRFHPLINNYAFSKNHLKVFKDRQTVFLDLTKSTEQIWQEEFSSKNRNMIRKAEKSGLKFRLGNNLKDYLFFREMYINTMKAVNAKSYYFFNENYFLNFKSLLDNKQSLLLAELNGEIIAGLLLMVDGKYAHYHLSARQRDFGKYAANNFLLEKAIRLAKEKGAEQFHFGGGNTTKDDDPLFKFKANFSKSRADFYIGKKIHNQDVYDEICNIWEKEYPELKDKYKNLLSNKDY